MDTPSEAIARKLAARLAPSMDPELPAHVDRAIAEGGGDELPTKAPDVSQVQTFASFVLAVSLAAWTIFNDVRNRRDKQEQAARDAAQADKLRALEHEIAFLKGVIVGRLEGEVEAPRGMTERVRVKAFEMAAEEAICEAIEQGKRRESGW